jgi:ribA/ribD-fused uncharacterized protein
LFGDDQAVEAILAASTPKAAKAEGRKVKNFDEKVWAAHCREIVARGNVEKFGQNGPLREYLLGTAGKVIVEASPYDRIWGIGLRPSRAKNPSEWTGQNLLGFTLMDVRSVLGDGTE